MTEDITCKKVSALLSQYIDNKVTPQERTFIEEHIAMCPDCYKKFIYLRNLINSLKDSYKKVMEMALTRQKRTAFSIREYEKFKMNLSPYIDNELEGEEGYEFRKYLMKSRIAQKELKNTYLMQKHLHNSFEKVKGGLDVDFSKQIIADFHQEGTNWRRQRFIKAAILAGLVLFGAAEFAQYSIPIKEKIQQSILKKKQPQYVNNVREEKTDSVAVKYR